MHLVSPLESVTDPCEPGARSDSARDWLVLLERNLRRWGGDLRRAQIFRRLAVRTGARVAHGWSAASVARGTGAAAFVRSVVPGPWAPQRPRLASSEQIRPDMLSLIRRATDPAVVAIYDDPVSQTASLGIPMSPLRRALYAARRDRNIAAFRWHAVPTRSFADLIGLAPETTIVAGNGTNVEHIRVGPWPKRPSIGMVSGAAPGRGIELLIEAAREVRGQFPDLELLLWLVPTGPGSAAYLDSLRRSALRHAWIHIGGAGYASLGERLAEASVLTIPHPPGDYMDVALPVKLFDSMAAGRPLVVTPRTETRAVVERHGAGVVARGDTRDDLAGALMRVLEDHDGARRMGAAARIAAERDYDWRVVGERVATAVLEREGLSPAGGSGSASVSRP